MKNKEFLINAVRLVEVDGSANIPTAISYAKTGETLIGSAATSGVGSRSALANFKLDLGHVQPGAATKLQPFVTPSGEKKSASALTEAFLHELLISARQWLANYDIDIAHGTSILLAEPLAMQTGLVDADWLSNYRRNLERILRGRGFEQIDFLPEPFAVFQYYRYGYRHPLVSERKKQNALVIDFGGGTFDVCVIETTKEGDISQTGRNSRPLAGYGKTR